MAGDHLEFGIAFPAAEAGRLGGNIAVAAAVEAVAPDHVVRVILIRQGIHIGPPGHGLMEGGVEHGHLGHAGHGLLTGLDALEVGGIVEGAQGDDRPDAFLHGLVHDGGGGELLAAMEDAVAHGADLAHILHDPDLRIGEGMEHQPDRVAVVLHVLLVFLPAPVGVLVGHERIGDADALAGALAEDGFMFHVEDLVFQGGAARVDDEDLHIVIFLSPVHSRITVFYFIPIFMITQRVSGKKHENHRDHCGI